MATSLSFIREASVYTAAKYYSTEACFSLLKGYDARQGWTPIVQYELGNLLQSSKECCASSRHPAAMRRCEQPIYWARLTTLSRSQGWWLVLPNCSSVRLAAISKKGKAFFIRDFINIIISGLILIYHSHYFGCISRIFRMLRRVDVDILVAWWTSLRSLPCFSKPFANCFLSYDILGFERFFLTVTTSLSLPLIKFS